MTPDAAAELVIALRELTAEIRASRIESQRQRAAPALVRAVAEYFGAARFTVAGLLAIANDEPHCALAEALSLCIDMNASPRSISTALGVLLSRLPELEIVGEQRGVAVYALRTYTW